MTLGQSTARAYFVNATLPWMTVLPTLTLRVPWVPTRSAATGRDSMAHVPA